MVDLRVNKKICLSTYFSHLKFFYTVQRLQRQRTTVTKLLSLFWVFIIFFNFRTRYRFFFLFFSPLVIIYKKRNCSRQARTHTYFYALSSAWNSFKHFFLLFSSLFHLAYTTFDIKPVWAISMFRKYKRVRKDRKAEKRIRVLTAVDRSKMNSDIRDR